MTILTISYMHVMAPQAARRKCWLPSTQLESCKQGEIERSSMDYFRKNTFLPLLPTTFLAFGVTIALAR